MNDLEAAYKEFYENDYKEIDKFIITLDDGTVVEEVF